MSTHHSAGPRTAAEAHPGTLQRLGYLYRANIIGKQREGRFLIWASFTATFVAVRFITHSIRDRRFQHIFHNVSGRGGHHIHHLVFGILGLLGVGYAATWRQRHSNIARRTQALTYGVSAALTMDEFALWLDLADVYWAKEGRVSVDATIVTAALMAGSFEGRDLFIAMGRDALRLWRRATGDDQRQEDAP